MGIKHSPIQIEDDMPQAAITDRSPHSPPYQRHRPEQTLLYQIIERYYPDDKPVGVELSISIAVPVCQSPATDGVDAGDADPMQQV
jgi:hypothetical protein